MTKRMCEKCHALDYDDGGNCIISLLVGDDEEGKRFSIYVCGDCWYEHENM